jgi:hypothetical protein
MALGPAAQPDIGKSPVALSPSRVPPWTRPHRTLCGGVRTLASRSGTGLRAFARYKAYRVGRESADGRRPGAECAAELHVTSVV